jgi:diaminopimelate decarboxylase/solute carrier family 35 protein E1
MTKSLPSTAVYAYTTLISMIVCLPFAIGMEGPQLQAGAAAAIAKVRQPTVHMDHCTVIIIFHLFEP